VKTGHQRCTASSLFAAAVVALAALAAAAGCGARPPGLHTSAAGGEGFPVRLRDALGVEVTIGARPERIVSAIGWWR